MSMQIEELTNYELAIRQRNDALELNKKYAAIIAAIHREESPGVIAELEAKLAGIAVQAPIQSGELTGIDSVDFLGRAIAASAEAMTSGPGEEWKSFIAHIESWAASAALAAPAAQQQASTAPAPVLRKLSDVMRKDPMSPEDFGLNGEHAHKARAYHAAMVAEAVQKHGRALVDLRALAGTGFDATAQLQRVIDTAPVAQAHALTDAEAVEIWHSLEGKTMILGANQLNWSEGLCKAFARAIAAHLTRKGA